MYGIKAPGIADLEVDMWVSTLELDEKYLVAYDTVGFPFKAGIFGKYHTKRSLVGRLAYDISQGLIQEFDIQSAEQEKPLREKRWNRYKTMSKDALIAELERKGLFF